MTASPEPPQPQSQPQPQPQQPQPQQPPQPQPPPRAQRRRHGTALDRLLATGFVAFFLYLLYLAMTSQLDDKVNLFAGWLRRIFT